MYILCFSWLEESAGSTRPNSATQAAAVAAQEAEEALRKERMHQEVGTGPTTGGVGAQQDGAGGSYIIEVIHEYE